MNLFISYQYVLFNSQSSFVNMPQEFITLRSVSLIYALIDIKGGGATHNIFPGQIYTFYLSMDLIYIPVLLLYG